MYVFHRLGFDVPADGIQGQVDHLGAVENLRQEVPESHEQLQAQLDARLP